MEIRNDKLICFDKEFDFSLSFEEALTLFEGHIEKSNDATHFKNLPYKSSNTGYIRLNLEKSFGIDAHTIMWFSNEGLEIELLPTCTEYTNSNNEQIFEQAINSTKYVSELVSKELFKLNNSIEESYNGSVFILGNYLVRVVLIMDRDFNEYMSFHLTIEPLTETYISDRLNKNYDVFVDKVSKETRNNIELSKKMCLNSLKLNYNCKRLVLGWFFRVKENYSFDGISMLDIMNREKYTYFEAIFRMNQLMSDPKAVKLFKMNLFRRK